MYVPSRDRFANRGYVHIDEELCVGCELCIQTCPLKCVIMIDPSTHKARIANAPYCAGCFKCLVRCPSKAIQAEIHRLA